ncbi:MAG TPA: undecaprenyldiphospho-muramoylpentapeptide beta-N-acetylglucosaminyltransferase [Gammaproteobacteria bacterium]|nr:undecaprenyldiphospho-muramoylpentapeptide beta-N-acetylglucosaminyltransferase [Gammaproteobacteria bacterium]
MDVRPVLIMAGGTGGHVFPALAVADELRARGVPVVWLGTKAGIESRLVPQAGYPIEWLSITGLRGKNTLTLLLAPLRIALACQQALAVLWRRKPCAVLGMGGFASGPGGIMAWLLRKPLLLQEQNAIAGLTNKILARFAGTVMQAFPGVFKGAITTGNPVRREICELPAPEQRTVQHDGALRLLVVGGSLGAVRLNEIIPQALALLAPAERPQVMHQTGVKNLDSAKACYRDAGVEAKVEAFIDDMAAAYDWADLVICRSGAMTVFELAAAGIASILVPYPHAVDDHQTANAAYLEQAGAAIIKQQNELEPQWLADTLRELMAGRDRLLQMARAARERAMPDAARTIADACMKAGGIV